MRRDASLSHEKDSVATTRDEQVSCVSAVYGANAAGKSNFLNALLALRSLVATDKFDKNQFVSSDDQDTLFRIIFEYNKRRYDYTISANSERVSYEKLNIYYSHQPTLIYEYNTSTHTFKTSGHLLRDDEETAIKYYSEKSPSRPILHLLKDSDNDDIANAFHFFANNIVTHSAPEDSNLHVAEAKLKLMLEKEGSDDAVFFNSIIPSADLGIRDVKLIDSESNLNAEQMEVLTNAIVEISKLGDGKMSNSDEEKLRRSMKRTIRGASFTHEIDDRFLNFKLRDESDGTIAASNIFTDLRYVLVHGATYVVDEIDRSLHPSLVIQLIDVFNNRDTNPHGAQLLFTTHDVSILDSSIYERNILDRDQVWFVEKSKKGESSLYSLAHIKGVRKEDNLYKKYICGRYGAIPKLSLYYKIQKFWEKMNND